MQCRDLSKRGKWRKVRRLSHPLNNSTGPRRLIAATTASALSAVSRKRDGTMNQEISAWPISTNAALIIQNLKPLLINQEFTKTSTNIEQFSYVSKLVALTDLYMQLRGPLVAALPAAEADLRKLGLS